MAELAVDGQAGGQLQEPQVVPSLLLPPDQLPPEAIEPTVTDLHHPATRRDDCSRLCVGRGSDCPRRTGVPRPAVTCNQTIIIRDLHRRAGRAPDAPQGLFIVGMGGRRRRVPPQVARRNDDRQRRGSLRHRAVATRSPDCVLPPRLVAPPPPEQSKDLRRTSHRAPSGAYSRCASAHATTPATARAWRRSGRAR